MTSAPKTPAPKTPAAQLEKTLIAIADRARKLEANATAAARDARAERLEAERALKLARGTGDVHVAAAAATRAARVTPAEAPLAERLEAILRGPFAPLELRAIATAAGEPAAKILDQLKRWRKMPCPTRSRDDAADAKQVYNMGSEDAPSWIWVIGDEAPAEELREMVKRLLRLKPMTFAELTLATGARRGRLSGQLVQLQRDGEKLEDLSETGSRVYRWFLRSKR